MQGAVGSGLVRLGMVNTRNGLDHQGMVWRGKAWIGVERRGSAWLIPGPAWWGLVRRGLARLAKDNMEQCSASSFLDWLGLILLPLTFI